MSGCQNAQIHQEIKILRSCPGLFVLRCHLDNHLPNSPQLEEFVSSAKTNISRQMKHCACKPLQVLDKFMLSRILGLRCEQRQFWAHLLLPSGLRHGQHLSGWEHDLWVFRDALIHAAITRLGNDSLVLRPCVQQLLWDTIIVSMSGRMSKCCGNLEIQSRAWLSALALPGVSMSLCLCVCVDPYSSFTWETAIDRNVFTYSTKMNAQESLVTSSRTGSSLSSHQKAAPGTCSAKQPSVSGCCAQTSLQLP